MTKYYIFIIFLGIAVTVMIVTALGIAGNPLDQQAIVKDNNKLMDLANIKNHIESYYYSNKKLPENLTTIATNSGVIGPITKKDYEYKILTETSYELCTEFSTDTTKEGTQSTVPQYDSFYPGNNTMHKKGYDCIKYQLPQQTQPTSQESSLKQVTQTAEPIHNFIENGSFEGWSKPFPDQWSLELGSQLNKAFQSYGGSNAIQFVAQRPKSSIKYEKIRVQPNKKYELSFYYKTESVCKDCALVGFQIFDASGGEIINKVSDCGEYNSEAKMWYQYIQEKALTYTKQAKNCSMPGNAATVRIKVGIWNPSDDLWEFDEFELN